MFDIGLGEIIVLAVIALIVFGPDQLPKAAASVGRFARQMREMASTARSELGDSAGLDSIGDELKSLRDLHPKRIIASAFEDPAESKPDAAAGRANGRAAPAAPRPPAADLKATGTPARAAGVADTPAGTPAEGPVPRPDSRGGAATPPANGYDPDAT